MEMLPGAFDGVVDRLDLYPEGSITLPGNFRDAPTAASLNNQGTPAARMFRDSDISVAR